MDRRGVLFLPALISLLTIAACEKSSSAAPMAVIGTFDYRQVSEAQILQVLKEAGIRGLPGPGSRVHQLLVPSDKAASAIDALQKSKLPGLYFYRAPLPAESMER